MLNVRVALLMFPPPVHLMVMAPTRSQLRSRKYAKGNARRGKGAYEGWQSGRPPAQERARPRTRRLRQIMALLPGRVMARWSDLAGNGVIVEAHGTVCAHPPVSTSGRHCCGWRSIDVGLTIISDRNGHAGRYASVAVLPVVSGFPVIVRSSATEPPLLLFSGKLTTTPERSCGRTCCCAKETRRHRRIHRRIDSVDRHRH